MDPRSRPPCKIIGLAALMVLVFFGAMLYWQFRGTFIPKTRLTTIAPRAGLVTDPGAKVTFNGVQIGRVSSITEVTHDGAPAARFALDVTPKYIGSIPANVSATIKATTVFGNKYVSLTSPTDPAPQHITPASVIYATSVTTEFNTLFENVTAISEKVDPDKLNLTLSAAAQALSGLGDRLGTALVNGNAILDDVNPLMPQVHRDIRGLAALGDIYADASADLWDAVNSTVTVARTVNQRRSDLDAALLASVGLANNGSEVFERGGPYLTRGAADLVPTGQLLDEYSPEIFRTIRNYDEVAPRIRNALGFNGYSLGAASSGAISGAPNPYIYPENLPRVNARGGPGGRPGCWQTITRDLWPAPYLVMNVGANMAPYNHLEIGQPLLNEYVWGRQFGENTINP
ncbi:MCE family protein [Mycobacterium ulcerans]|uniref:MCE family protein n=2 Tax=Mycobacterium ulcerans TaxID=1809 RepID=A0ABY3V8L8_MYCUL|nr:MCE family protein [Mycobacterium ulcerans]EUA92804.1 mce related family protein [Mycobacterium ulcerans str. Harvey]UDM34939.1 MCE family protein [Mycobacterium ulcerans]ULP52239.1 MCE family protein [Mycobacterium ulcerans]